MSNEKGYVIRCHDLHDGSTYYRGCKELIAQTKAGITVGDTYTLSGAKRALSNLQRLSHDPDHQYSIERLDEFYSSRGIPVRSRDREEQCQRIDHAMKRLDELWNGNYFDNDDKMRINEVRRVLRGLKEDLAEE